MFSFVEKGATHISKSQYLELFHVQMPKFLMNYIFFKYAKIDNVFKNFQKHKECGVS